LIIFFFWKFRSLSHILLLQMDNYSETQVKTFSRETLEDLRKDIKSKLIGKEKVTREIKSILQEYIEVRIFYYHHSFAMFPLLTILLRLLLMIMMVDYTNFAKPSPNLFRKNLIQQQRKNFFDEWSFSLNICKFRYLLVKQLFEMTVNKIFLATLQVLYYPITFIESKMVCWKTWCSRLTDGI